MGFASRPLTLNCQGAFRCAGIACYKIDCTRASAVSRDRTSTGSLVRVHVVPLEPKLVEIILPEIAWILNLSESGVCRRAKHKIRPIRFGTSNGHTAGLSWPAAVVQRPSCPRTRLSGDPVTTGPHSSAGGQDPQRQTDYSPCFRPPERRGCGKCRVSPCVRVRACR